MQEKKQLWEMIREQVGITHLAAIEVPAFVRDNLRFELFDWQVSALQYFLAYEDPQYKRALNVPAPAHLLFNMATGTGKTLLMAALLLYYYKKGYRHFIFLVNQNNIVGKTEENLVNPQHIKYLFKQCIVIDNKTIAVKKVSTFSTETEDIEILFTTVHKLHNAVYAVQENTVYLEDLQQRNIVMLADEAHHLNADTKKKKGAQLELDELETALAESAGAIDLEKSWENTICKKILERKGAARETENKNVLIEFTATIPNELSVAEKYNDKTVYRFDLPAFLNAGYTKEINLVTSTADTKQIILQALLFNWYRNTIALRNNIAHFKPVILFRSKTIAESISDYETFGQLIRELSPPDFDFLQQISDESVDGKEVYLKGKSRLLDLKHFIAENSISFSSVIDYLKYAFGPHNCIITNSKDKSAKGKRGEEKTTEEQDRLLNSLEDKNNPITAIFTVQRLNEGWDVLNLFDIVRLYRGRDEGKTKTGQRKAGPATTSEVQLIGRGIRYYPFEFENGPRLKRKFDDRLDHELRVLEEFYFHSYDDDKNRYIDELKRELREKGFIDDDKVIRMISPKAEFTKHPFFKKVKFWVNAQVENPEARKNTLEEIKPGFAFTYNMPVPRLHEEGVVLDETQEDREKYTSKTEDRKTLARTFGDFEKHIVRKAINIKAKKDGSLFRYMNLKKELNINSMDEMLRQEFIGDLPLNITVPHGYHDFEALPNKTQLDVLLDFFDTVEERLKDVSNPYIGSEFTETTVGAVFGIPKERVVKQSEESRQLAKELENRDWYAFDSFSGTSEEIVMIRFIEENMENLKERYDSVYLLKNEQIYTLYNFQSGKKFQPDYLLLLKEKEQNSYVQMIIEAKGDQFKDKDGNFTLGKEGWKELFLEQIAGSELKEFENARYKITALPFFNEKNEENFRQKFNERLKLHTCA